MIPPSENHDSPYSYYLMSTNTPPPRCQNNEVDQNAVNIMFLTVKIIVHDSITIIEEEIELNIIWHDDYICTARSTNFNPHSRQTIIFNHNLYFIQRILSFLFPQKN